MCAYRRFDKRSAASQPWKLAPPILAPCTSGGSTAVPVFLRLMIEQLPGWHADHARFYSLGGQFFVGVHAQRNLAARFRSESLPARRPARPPGRRRLWPRPQRAHTWCGRASACSGARESDRPARCRNSMITRQASATSLASPGPKHDEARNGAQRNQLLHRLMRGPIFADADGIVREDVDDGKFHQRAQANGRAHVVAKNQEARAVRPDFR